MKRLIALILIAMLLVPTVALASDITAAKWYSIITASNNNTAADDVFTTFPLLTQNLIDGNFLNANLLDCAMHDTSGADTAFMPAVNATYPWCLYVNHIGEDAFRNYLLYTGGNADMGGKLRYFPGVGGMTCSDNTTLELSDNFTIEQKGWIDTDNGTDKNLVYKENAFELFVSPTVSENITATILSANTTVGLRPDSPGDYTNITSQSPAATLHWDKVDDAINGGDGDTTYVYEAGSAQKKDAYNTENGTISSDSNINSVTVYYRCKKHASAATAYAQPFLRLDGSETTGTEISLGNAYVLYNEVLARPGGGSWQPSDIPDLQIVMGLRGDDVERAYLTQTYIVVDYSPGTSVTATGVESGEHIVRVDYIANLLTNGNFEIGDPPDDWALVGAAATVSRSAVQAKAGTYSALLTRNGTDCYLTQDGANPTDYAGEKMTLGVWVYATVANRARVRLSDGLTSTYSSYHSGDAGWEWLTATHTFAAVPTVLRSWCRINTGDTAAYFDGAILVIGDSISSSVADYGNFIISIDGSETGMWTDTPNINVYDNSNGWTFIENYSMPYMEYHKIWIDGVLQQHIEYEYDDTVFSDLSANNQDTTPTFRTGSSDADVSAIMASFSPVEEAQAPPWVLSVERDFFSENVTATGEFTTTPTPTAAPGIDIIEAISAASGTPSQLPFNVIAGFVIVAVSITGTWFLSKHGSRNLWLKIILITVLMAFAVAVEVFDFWMVLFFLIMAIAVALFSRQRSQV